MVDIPPDMHLLAIRIKSKYAPELRDLTKDFFAKMLEDAEEYRGCYITFWKFAGISSLFVYRKDRRPTDSEVLPWAQELFDNGEIHRNLGHNYMWCIQGEAAYTTDNVADMIGNSFADAADKDSNADAFDFDKTKLGKRLARLHRNGTN